MPRLILPEPSDELKQLSRSLSERIRQAMSNAGVIPFSRFMEMALYEPGLGYYSAGLHKLGASGDFITAPELGSLFAECVALQAIELKEMIGGYDIFEAGAGSGKMAADLLRALAPDNLPDRYLVLERSADLRRVQARRITDQAPEFADRVEWLDAPPEDRWQGLMIANEVIDALAVERFQIGSDTVEQLCVQEHQEGFTWTQRPAPEHLEAAVRQIEADLDSSFSEGYRSEINLQLPAWLGGLTERMSTGLALFIDYGYPRREYYMPERSDGTVMCHYRHRAHEDVFFWPGLQDITAWVDFTALAEASEICGLEVEGYANQAMFLLGCGLDRVLAQRIEESQDGGLALNSQARQLTLPGMMGERFQVMGLGRGLEDPLRGFSLQDLRHRL
jgi:SAM-dependent MidA family methyltransferase